MQLTLIITSVLIGIVIGGENQPSSSLCDKKYQQHYAALDCTPVFENDPECPSFYKCPEAEKNITGCLYNGRVYQGGEKLDIRDPCQSCECYGLAGKYIYLCSRNTCRTATPGGCYSTHAADVCCSTGTKCLSSEERKNKENTCDYNGRKYRYGERILPKEDRCQTCICNKDWNGIYGKGCSRVDCTIGLKREQLQKGCIPIYTEDKCCPIKYYCNYKRNLKEELQDTTKPLATQEDIQSGKSCKFNGLHYQIGQALNIKYEEYGKNPCATCTCHIPPIFTCIQKKSCT